MLCLNRLHPQQRQIQGFHESCFSASYLVPNHAGQVGFRNNTFLLGYPGDQVLFEHLYLSLPVSYMSQSNDEKLGTRNQCPSIFAILVVFIKPTYRKGYAQSASQSPMFPWVAAVHRWIRWCRESGFYRKRITAITSAVIIYAPLVDKNETQSTRRCQILL